MKLVNLFGFLVMGVGILVVFARIIELITYSEFKGSMLVVFALLLAVSTLDKLSVNK